MIKVAICEDDKLCSKTIRKMLNQYFTERGIEYQLREYESANSFIIQKVMAEILILDIEMDGITGIELKDWLCTNGEDVKILFVTNYMEFMPEAFGRNVYGFLGKPVAFGDLAKYLNRMTEDIEENRSLVIKSVDKEFAIKMNHIFYFESEDKYSRVVSKDGRHFSDKSLGQWEEELRESFFFRCHKRYLVNFRNIYKVESFIWMCNGDEIPISRRKGKELRDSYREYIIRKAR
ncbi:DNA-binding response regulator [Lachnospiraceae bacterium]|nr:DNA-binding response regulator [Lachnospiraceae bacterium]